MGSVGVIIQARIGSTRLPGKILKEFNRTTILLHIINTIKKTNLPICVATTLNEIDDSLVEYLESNNINYYRGSENNVLDRFIKAADKYNFSHVVRVCSDNPFIDYTYINNLLEYLEPEIDYLSYSFNSKPTILSHFGIFTEIVSVDALNRVKLKFGDNSMYCEHVTNGVYTNPELFNIKLIEIDKKFENYTDIRLTVDTEEDFQNLKILDNFFVDKENLNFFQIADFILENPAILKLMTKNIIKNKK